MANNTNTLQQQAVTTYTRGLVSESCETDSIVYAEYSGLAIAALRAREDYEDDTGMMEDQDDGNITGLVEVWGDGWRVHLERRAGDS